MRSYFSLLGILRLIATLPLFVIFLISSWYLILQYNINMNLKDLRYKFAISLDLVNLSKELDKEMIINDVSSKNINRQITDHTIEHIKNLHFDTIGLKPILNRLELLPQIRHTLDDPNFNKTEILSYYRDINLLIKDEICSKFTLESSIVPLVIAPAIKKVPATILSGIGVYSPPFKVFTPFITILLVPAPSILPPLEFIKSARSTISGSFAAL